VLIGTFRLLVWIGAVGLVLVAWVRLRARFRAQVDKKPLVDDDAVRRILDTGVLVSEEDEPLDLRQVQEEERRFWRELEGELWDEAEEAEEW
jgi:hypothetical protein